MEVKNKRLSGLDCFYVYLHRRVDNGVVFYVGKGKNRRAYSNAERSRWWQAICNKTDHTVEIVAKDMSESMAFELEEFLILLYGRQNTKNGTLVNLTNGGEGLSGWIISEETREKMRKAGKAKKLTEEHKNKIRQTFTGLRSGSKHPLYGTTHSGRSLSSFSKNKISQTRITRGVCEGAKNPTAKKVININTLEIVNCAKDLCLRLNMKYSTLISMLSEKNPNKTVWVYLNKFKHQ